MKILLICERTSGSGGWYTYARDLQISLQQRGHEVTVTCANAHPLDGEAILPSPLELLSRPWKAFSAARRVTALAEKIQPDIIHIVVEPYAFVVPFLPKKLRERTVLTIHGSYGVQPLQKFFTRLLARRYYSQISRFITVSKYTKERTAEAIEEFCGEKLAAHFAAHAHVIPNGIVLPKRVDHLRDPGMKNILLVGGVKERKGVLEAIAACAIFRSKHPEISFQFSVVGTCNEKNLYVQAVRQRIEDLDLSSHVQLTGEISNVELQSMYEKEDLYLMPSTTTPDTFEGFGLAFLEANAYGVPCIGPDTSGAAEAILEGKSGYHVDPENPQQISKFMEWVLLESRIQAEDCRTWAEAHSITTTVGEIEKVYARKKTA